MYLDELKDKFKWIPDITYEEFFDYVRLLPDNMCDDIFEYMLTSKLAIRKMCQNMQELIRSDKLPSVSEKILSNYTNSFNNMFIACSLAYNIEHNIPYGIDELDMCRYGLAHTYVQPNTTIKSTLRRHQEVAMYHILNRNKNILIATTGSGKSLMAIYYAEYWYKRGIDRIIVVAERNPEIFKDELRKHLTFFARQKYEIITYFNMKNFIKEGYDYRNTLFIFDEVHLLKNRKSERASVLSKIKIHNFLGITATIVDKYSDIENLLRNLQVDCELNEIAYKLDTSFIENAYSINNVKIPIQLNDKERIAYSNLPDVGNFFKYLHSRLGFLADLDTKLPKIVDICLNHPNDKILIFSNYYKSIDKIHNHVNYVVGDCEQVTGRLDNKKKNDMIEDFIEGNTRILVSSDVTKASYNLQEANVIIFVDYSYAVIKRLQAEGRIKRIGQNKQIYFYDIFYENTIEETIYNVIEDKKAVLEDIQDLEKEIKEDIVMRVRETI